MGISGIPAIPMIITCLLQGTPCNTGIPRTFYGGKIRSVSAKNKTKSFLCNKEQTAFIFVKQKHHYIKHCINTYIGIFIIYY